MRRALAAGVPGERIVFSGVGKTRREMAFALDSGILCFNVESEPELEALSEVAVSKGTRAPISIRINPDVDAKTHKKISTGKSENKFGIPIARARDVYARAARSQGHRGHRRRHAYRQPDHRSRPLRQRHRAAGRARPRPHGRRPQAASHRSRRRPRRALSRGQRAPARSAGLCGDHQAPHQGSRPQARVRDGPHDRRQCGRARHAGDLREARAPTSPS